MCTFALLTTWFICVTSLGVFGSGWLAWVAMTALAIIGIVIISALHAAIQKETKK